MSATSCGYQSCYVDDEVAFEEQGRPGSRRRAMLGDQLALWRITGGTDGSILHHQRENEQFVIIVRGQLDVRIGDPDDQARETRRPGDGQPITTQSQATLQPRDRVRLDLSRGGGDGAADEPQPVAGTWMDVAP